MVSPLSAVTQGLISDGSHIPLIVSVQGLLIFAFVSVGSSSGGGQITEEEDRRGHRFRKGRHEQQGEEEEEIFAIINAFLATQ